MTYNSKNSKKIVKKKVNKTVKGGMFGRIGTLFKMNRTTNKDLNAYFEKLGRKNPYSKKINVSPVEESKSEPSNAALSNSAPSNAVPSNAMLSNAAKTNFLNKPLGTRMGGCHKCKYTKKHRK